MKYLDFCDSTCLAAPPSPSNLVHLSHCMARHKEDRLGYPQGRGANQSCQQPMLEPWEGNSSSRKLNTTALTIQQLQHQHCLEQLLHHHSHSSGCPDHSVTHSSRGSTWKNILSVKVRRRPAFLSRHLPPGQVQSSL